MTARCYVDPAGWPDRSDQKLDLSPEESHHLLHVLRAKPGERVVVFDGQGREAVCELASTAGEIAGLRVLESRRAGRHGAEIGLAQALVKGPRMDWLIEKATELGAARVIPLESERSVIRLREGDREKRRERWQKIAVSAAKQCGTAWVPVIAAAQPLATFLAEGPAADLLLLCDPGRGAQPLRSVLREAAARAVRRAVALVGPEGDFTEAEKEAARAAGAIAVSLGPRTLRAETAALYILSALSYEL